MFKPELPDSLGEALNFDPDPDPDRGSIQIGNRCPIPRTRIDLKFPPDSWISSEPIDSTAITG